MRDSKYRNAWLNFDLIACLMRTIKETRRPVEALAPMAFLSRFSGPLK